MKLQIITDAKTCRGCGKTLPLGAFGKDMRAKDGRLGICKVCVHDRHVREYAALRQDPERYAALLKQRREYGEAWRRRKGARKRVVVKVPEGMKRCPRCGKVMPIADFRRRSYCPECAREVSHEWWERVKASVWKHEMYKLKRRKNYKGRATA